MYIYRIQSYSVIVSHVKGVDGRQALNKIKVGAIWEVLYQQFPINGKEPKIIADKVARNAMDEVCQRK